MSYSVDDFVREAGAQLSRYGEQETRFQSLAADSEKKRADLQTRLRAAARDLAAALLPDNDPARFDALAQRLAAPELPAILVRSHERERAIDARLSEIEGEPQFRDRDTLRIRLERQMDETGPLRDYAVQDLRAMESLAGLADLVARGYGTPAYPHRGWIRYFSPGYLRDWKRADEIVEELKAADFAEVTSRYADRKEQADVLGRTVAEIQGQQDRIAALEREHEALTAERAGLPDAVRTEAGLRIAALLRGGKTLVDGLDGAETLRSRLLEMDGMEHQAQYLESLRMRIEEDLSDLHEREDKLRAERDRYAANLYRFRNKRFTQDQFARRFGRDDRYNSRYDRYRRTADTVYVFHDYDRASGLEDFLWWDIVTNGRLNGSYIPEVQSYYDANPDYRFDRSAFAHSGGGDSFSSGFGGDDS